MNQKKILIVDDNRALGLAISTSLKKKGFYSLYTDKVATARELAENHWKDLDVVVFDMRLEDPNESEILGADIGISIREKKNSFPPEFLIYSAFGNEKDYYQLAIDLGVAAYLEKKTVSSTELIKHIRVLALRHALSSPNSQNKDKILSIAAESRSFNEAVTRFCKEVIEPEFDSCLGVPFIILFSKNYNQTYNCASNTDLPKGTHPIYSTLQKITHREIGNLMPIEINFDNIELPESDLNEELIDKLNQTLFIPLPLSNDFNLSIGLLPDFERNGAEDTHSLISLIQKYLKDTINDLIYNLWHQFERYKILAIQSNTAKFCGFVGQEIKDLLEVEEKELRELADDLIDTGGILWNSLTKIDKATEPISVKELADNTWSWIKESIDDKRTRLPSLIIEEDCQILANRGDLEVGFARLLHWLAQRTLSTPADLEPTVIIRCEKIDEEVNIIFEDRSRRLDSKLRGEIFSPLTQAVPIPFGDLIKHGEQVSGKYLPLFLAKTLIPSLADHSDDEDLKEKSYGHRFMMQFPFAGLSN